MRKLCLARFLKNKRALGTPVGNLMVLVAAVLLMTTVIIFAMNLTTAQVQKEKLYIVTAHVWYVNSTSSVAAIGLSNTGATDVVLSKIDVKGLICQWNGTNNYVLYCRMNGTLPGDLPMATNLDNTSNNTITIAGQPYEFTTATEGITVKAGSSIAFYVVVPDRVMVYDLATPLRMVVSTTQAIYIAETLVQATA
jgi:hypothetical protein